MYYTTYQITEKVVEKNRNVLYFVYNIDTKLKFSLYI